jgi:SAM-dependent methyltransferase
MSSLGPEKFSIDRARAYWKHAPTGFGKMNSEDLLELEEDEFKAILRTRMKERYFYFWEDVPVVNHFCEMFRGKNVLAFGTGLGPEEIRFLKAGARVTCADIVESNLKTIERIVALEGLEGFSSLLMEDPSLTEFPDSIDFFYARGSLQTMPFELQKTVIEKIKEKLAPNGQLIFLVYTQGFVDQTCPTDDPVVFARFSDPSVGDCHNPWSEWYDDDKVRELIGEDMYIAARQTLHYDRNNWYIAARKNPDEPSPPYALILDFQRFEDSCNSSVHSLDLSEFSLGDAEINMHGETAISITTGNNNYGYAALFPVLEFSPEQHPEKIFVSADIKEGGLNIGLLNCDTDEFFFSKSIPALGQRDEYFYLYSDEWPQRVQVIISNFRPTEPNISKFTIKNIEFLKVTDAGKKLLPKSLFEAG